MRLLSLLVAVMLAAPAWGQISAPAEVAVYQPIVATSAQAADGYIWRVSPPAVRRSVDGGRTIHIWAPPGSYTVELITTRLQIDWDKKTWQFLQDEHTAAIVVKGVGPEPGPDPPVPPQPGGKWEVMLFYEADQLDNYPEPQRQLLTSLKLRDELTSAGHLFYRVVEAGALTANVAGSGWEPWFNAVKGDPMPRVAIRPRGGGAIKDVQLPSDRAALLKLLEGK